jgi:hypothetical protein
MTRSSQIANSVLHKLAKADESSPHVPTLVAGGLAGGASAGALSGLVSKFPEVARVLNLRSEIPQQQHMRDEFTTAWNKVVETNPELKNMGARHGVKTNLVNTIVQKLRADIPEESEAAAKTTAEIFGYPEEWFEGRMGRMQYQQAFPELSRNKRMLKLLANQIKRSVGKGALIGTGAGLSLGLLGAAGLGHFDKE